MSNESHMYRQQESEAKSCLFLRQEVLFIATVCWEQGNVLVLLSCLVFDKQNA